MSDWTVYYVVIKKRRMYFVLHLWLGLVFLPKFTACAHLKRQRQRRIRRRRIAWSLWICCDWVSFCLLCDLVVFSVLFFSFLGVCCCLFFLLHSIKNRWYDEEQIEEEIKEMTALGHLMNLCLPLKCTHALNPADRLRCRLFHNEMLILQAHTCIKPRAYSTYTRLYF